MDLLVVERGMLEDQVEMEVESLVERLNGRARELQRRQACNSRGAR